MHGKCTEISSLLDSAIGFDNYRNVESKDVVRSLSALGHELRLSVFRKLVKRGPQGFTPGELSEQLEVAAPTLSFHLKELQFSGLALVRREGRFLYYSANFDRIASVLIFLTDQCCVQVEHAVNDDFRSTVANSRGQRA